MAAPGSAPGATSAQDHPRGRPPPSEAIPDPLFAQRSLPRPPSKKALRGPRRLAPGGSPQALTRSCEGHRRPARTRSAGASPPPKSDQLAPAPGAGLRGTRSAAGAEAESSKTAEAPLRRSATPKAAGTRRTGAPEARGSVGIWGRCRREGSGRRRCGATRRPGGGRRSRRGRARRRAAGGGRRPRRMRRRSSQRPESGPGPVAARHFGAIYQAPRALNPSRPRPV